MKWGTNVTTVSKKHEKDNKESVLNTIDGIGQEEHSRSLTKCSRNRAETINKSEAVSERLEKLNEKLVKLMRMVQGNCENFKQLNDDVTNLRKDMQEKFDDMKRMNDDTQTLKKNAVEPNLIVPNEEMATLVIELT